MSSEVIASQPEYRAWLGQLKTRFRQVQLKAAVAVNTALLQFYWELGADIVARQKDHAWGQSFLAQLSADLMREFPEVAGFSVRNLKYIRQWHLFWEAPAIGQQPVAQMGPQPATPHILTIPWGHNLAIITKCKQHDEALYYVQNTIPQRAGAPDRKRPLAARRPCCHQLRTDPARGAARQAAQHRAAGA